MKDKSVFKLLSLRQEIEDTIKEKKKRLTYAKIMKIIAPLKMNKKTEDEVISAALNAIEYRRRQQEVKYRKKIEYLKRIITWEENNITRMKEGLSPKRNIVKGYGKSQKHSKWRSEYHKRYHKEDGLLPEQKHEYYLRTRDRDKQKRLKRNREWKKSHYDKELHQYVPDKLIPSYRISAYDKPIQKRRKTYIPKVRQ